MGFSRRSLIFSSIAGAVGGLLGARSSSAAVNRTPGHSGPPPKPLPARKQSGRTMVISPNGTSLPYRMVNGVKEFHLIAEPVRREFVNGLEVNCWGYNGVTPGPTIEAFEGDRVRLLVTNRLPEGTSVHWHGFVLPNGMDGVSGLNQPKIGPGETYAYEFTLRQTGTLMYHPHFD